MGRQCTEVAVKMVHSRVRTEKNGLNCEDNGRKRRAHMQDLDGSQEQEDMDTMETEGEEESQIV